HRQVDHVPGDSVGSEEPLESTFRVTSDVARSETDRRADQVDMGRDCPSFYEGESQSRFAILARVLEELVNVAEEESGLFDLDLTKLGQSSQVGRELRGPDRLEGMMLRNVAISPGVELPDIQR